MLLLRSYLFNFLFYLMTALIMLVGLPLLLAPKQWTMDWVYKVQARTSLFLLKYVCGLDHKIEGLENLPKGPFLIAAKHQAAWDTFAPIPYLRYPYMILKEELYKIPLLGWYIKKYGHVPIRRTKIREAIKQLLTDARDRMQCDACELVIFPEGTRVLPGEKTQYKQGIFRIYEATQLPVVPMALNSGLFWRRKSPLRYSGCVTARFLKPIQPGLDAKTFMRALEEQIESETTELMNKAIEEFPHIPAPNVAED